MTVVPIEDPIIKIKPSNELIDVIVKKVKTSDNTPESVVAVKNSSTTEQEKCLLSLKDIKWLKEYLMEYRKKSGENIYLHQLLSGTDVVLPQPKVLPRNPELDARIKKLTAQQNAREYAAMTKSVDSVRKRFPEDSIAFQMKEINKQLIAVAQFVISVITGFVFGFIGIELIIGNLDFGFRLLLGIICALTIALAEIYFLAKKLNEDFTYEVPVHSTNKKMHQD